MKNEIKREQFKQFQLPNNQPKQLDMFESRGSELFLTYGSMKSPNYSRGRRGWAISHEGLAEFQNIRVGSQIITLSAGDSIQAAVNELNNSGRGGIISLQDGTWEFGADTISLYSNITIQGISPNKTILDFNSTAGKLSIQGTNVYSTGSIFSISTNGQTVTGNEGCSWLTSGITALRDSFFINGRWHLIAATTSNTTMVLAEPYFGPTVTNGDTYRVSSIVSGVVLNNLMVKGSTGSAIDCDNASIIGLNGVVIMNSNIGVDMAYCSQSFANEIVSTGNTSHGVSLDNCGLFDWEGVFTPFNGGDGVNMTSCRTIPIVTSSSDRNTGNGYKMTSCKDIYLNVEAARNTIGIEAVSGNDNIMMDICLVDANSSDGIKLTATTDNSKISTTNITNNGGWGINIAAATCDNNILLGVTASGNSSGSLTDSGTGTLKSTTVNVIP